MSCWLPPDIELLPRTKEKVEEVSLAFFNPLAHQKSIISNAVARYFQKRLHKMQLPPAEHKIHSELQQKHGKRLPLSSTQNNPAHTI